jgi:hypothetical protein
MLVDPFLQNVIRFAERVGGRLPITLNVNGRVISGLIVSEEVFVRGLAREYDQYRAEVRGEQTEPSEAAIKVYREMLGWEPSEAGQLPLYIHLQEPYVHQAGGSTDVKGEWWRGRLEAVDGFQFGRPSSPRDD